MELGRCRQRWSEPMTDVQRVGSSRAQKRKRARRESVAQPPAIDPKTGTLDYDAAVAEAKQIIARGEKDHWRLAELAATLETQEGKKSLKKFAADIGVAVCTLERLIRVWKAWAEFPGAPPKFYSVAQALQELPVSDKIAAMAKNPTMREAREFAREHKQKKDPNKGKQKLPDSPRLKEYRKYLRDAVIHAKDAASYADIVDENLDNERLEALRNAIERELLDDLRDHGNRIIKLYNFLQRLLDEGDKPTDAQDAA